METCISQEPQVVKKDVHVNSTIANHTLCGKKNVHKVLIIYLWKARPGSPRNNLVWSTT